MLKSPKVTRAINRTASFLCALMLGSGMSLQLAAVGAGSALLPQRAMAQEAAGKDLVIFTSGQQVEGTILEETPTTVRMKVVVAGIAAETTYQKADILKIQRAAAAAPAAPDATKKEAPKAPASAAAPAPAKAADPGVSGAQKVYVIELTGVFGEDISQTPIRNAVRDAKKADADVIIVVLDNDWSQQGGLEEKKDDDAAFDQLFRAEAMAPVFTEEIPREWTKQPKIVFWVKKAMGGAAFLPLICRDIYFSSEGKMGGIGNLSRLFGSTGDEVVRQKQYSLRMGHAEGLAIQGGYPVELVRAMAQTEYVLSVRYEGGRPVFLTREPESPDELLLTDDGTIEEKKDNIEALARGEGNDVLTLHSDLARKLGVSKGTADRLEDLIFQLGLSRNYQLVKGQSSQITKGWTEGLDSAKRQIRKLWESFNQVEVKQPGGYRERTQARGQRIKILDEMISIIRKYEEALNPNAVGVPGINDLEAIKQQLRLEQLADKPERR